VLFYLFKSEHMPLLMMWWWLWGAFNIPEHIFVPLLFCIVFGWTYVNADDAANKYLYLKYTMWFLLTWTACKKRSWLSLFYDFLLCHCEWGIHICQTWKYLHAIAILQLFPEHVSANVAWHQISSSQLYRLRICSHYYHCLCFMLFFSWGIFVCFRGYCFLHFGCGCRELRVAQFQPPNRL